jgi:hypothetical protein
MIALSISSASVSMIERSQMQAEPQQDKRRNGRVPGDPFKRGMNSRKRKQVKVAAKLDELTAEYFPHGGYSVMDANRLKLAAAHYVDADLCRDPVIRQRATRCAEYLLAKLKPPGAPRSPAADQADQAAAALALLLKSPDAV